MVSSIAQIRGPAVRPGLRGNRDKELVSFVARHGTVAVAHVMAAMRAGRAATYRRVAVCTRHGLLERLQLVPGEPAFLRATPEGLRYSGLGLSASSVSSGRIDHQMRCVSTAQLLADEFGPERVITERELRLLESVDGEPLVSAPLPDGRIHRPNMAVLTDEGAIAIEIELSPKGPSRLGPIIDAWKRATSVKETRYYAKPGTTRRGLERAIATTRAEDRIRLFTVPAA